MIWLHSVALLFEIYFTTFYHIPVLHPTMSAAMFRDKLPTLLCALSVSLECACLCAAASSHQLFNSQHPSHQYWSKRPPKPNVVVLDVLESFADTYVSIERYRSTLGARKAFGHPSLPPRSFPLGGRESWDKAGERGRRTETEGSRQSEKSLR